MCVCVLAMMVVAVVVVHTNPIIAQCSTTLLFLAPFSYSGRLQVIKSKKVVD